MCFSYLNFLSIILSFLIKNVSTDQSLEAFLEDANEQLLESARFQNFAYWNFSVNMTESTQNMYIKTAIIEARIWRPFYAKSLKFNASFERQIKILKRPTFAILTDMDYAEYLKICTDMERLYGEPLFCSYEDNKNCDLNIQTDLMRIFAQQRDSDMLKYYWEQFYNELISKTKSLYSDFVRFHKKALTAANFKTIDEWYFASYDQLSIKNNILEIYKSIVPFYVQLHGYVRHRLSLYYGSEIVSQNGPIPMHLLGSIWAEDWSNIQHIIVPYPEKLVFDVTNEMRAQNFNVNDMYKFADNFMQSLGLRKLPISAWKTCIGTPNPRLNIYCRPRSFDFYKYNDVCVRSCTPVSHAGFQNVYHEMGHLQYFLQYANKPFLLRNSPSPDLHETIGDVIALSAMSPDFLEQIGLLYNYTYDEETRINYLFRMALEKIVFLPFALSSDAFFWALLQDQVEPGTLNCAFWKKREEYTGVKPPVERQNRHFDAFVNYYIAGDVELLRYIKAIILQFELYSTACKMIEEPPVYLEKCNFYHNGKVGKAFQKLLSSGAEKNWLDAVREFGSKEPLSAKALKEYFKPLIKWLEETNRVNNVTIGWPSSQRCLVPSYLNADRKKNEATQTIVDENVKLLIVFGILWNTVITKFLLKNLFL